MLQTRATTVARCVLNKVGQGHKAVLMVENYCVTSFISSQHAAAGSLGRGKAGKSVAGCSTTLL